jgi:hypothetical protein
LNAQRVLAGVRPKKNILCHKINERLINGDMDKVPRCLPAGCPVAGQQAATGIHAALRING